MAALILYVNLLVGAAGFTIYGLWAGKWLARRAYTLFVLNALASIAVGAIAIGYGVLARTPEQAVVSDGLLRYLLPLLISVPVITRIIEYRRDEARVKYAQDVVQTLMTEANVEPTCSDVAA